MFQDLQELDIGLDSYTSSPGSTYHEAKKFVLGELRNLEQRGIVRWNVRDTVEDVQVARMMSLFQDMTEDIDSYLQPAVAEILGAMGA